MTDMSRRSALAALVGAAQTVGLSAPALAKSPTGKSRPNVLFIAIDDMNDWTGWLGGYPLTSTPNQDALAASGAAFTRAYTPAAQCNAARASVMFAQHPWRSGIYTNGCRSWTEVDLANGVSLPRAFKRAGYRTFYAGKVFSQGFSRNTADNDPTSWTDPLIDDRGYDSKEAFVWKAQGTRGSTADMARARRLGDEVLSRTHDKPFFAALGLQKPHMKWTVPQEYFDRFPEALDMPYPLGSTDRAHYDVKTNSDLADLGPAGKLMAQFRYAGARKMVALGQWRQFVRAYLAAIAASDDAMGAALKALRDGPNASDTIIVVWSDHGWQLGEKLAWSKCTLWERALRIPVIFAGPGVKAQKTGALFSSVDIYKTLAGLAGVESPHNLDGENHSRFLRGTSGPARDRVVSAWAFDPEADTPTVLNDRPRTRHFSVRSKNYRLIQYGTGERELYDHRSDPWEFENLAERKDSRHAINVLARDIPAKPAIPAVGADVRKDDDDEG